MILIPIAAIYQAAVRRHGVKHERACQQINMRTDGFITHAKRRRKDRVIDRLSIQVR
jgi:hypothetical protein